MMQNEILQTQRKIAINKFVVTLKELKKKVMSLMMKKTRLLQFHKNVMPRDLNLGVSNIIVVGIIGLVKVIIINTDVLLVVVSLVKELQVLLDFPVFPLVF
jgi:hypothetical protein